MKTLDIQYCKGADIFLLKLTSGSAPPWLKIFSLIHDIGADSDRTIHAVEELLTYPKNTIRSLVLCLRNAPHLPNINAIRAHGATLRRLLLDIGPKGRSNDPNHKLVYDTGKFLSLLRTCSSLKELGITFPAVLLEYNNFAQEAGELRVWVEAVASKLKLATLNIINWPTGYNANQSLGYYASKTPQLARVAADIFRRHRQYDRDNETFVTSELKCTLEVVAFGVREQGPYTISPCYFMQSEVSVLGKKRLHAEAVTLKALQDEDLNTAVLGYEARDFDEQSRWNFHVNAGWNGGQVQNGGW